ncbi:class I SAM-dependent methyltransferase [Oceanobacillus chungangensis]|uniref:Class I SAM-dependent methyltransferase n=1 Tax=Oceanobacillus chungangensis TaxID=1229152 RepID=A0A3D8PRK4_9BACI|nr:class I SAM-dependent methyltransferase [Oceanobacillus chungangensis]RDW17898.1 class I SAM-dependent methyltransferase [Oceanobacillus chungangensis]
MNEKKSVQEVFSKNKEAYFTSSTHANGNDLSVLIHWLNPNKDLSALDIATGGGHAAKKLAPNVKKVFATDITKEMLENTAMHLQSYPNINYVIADAESLPFLDNSFDIITCRIAAHHFPNPDRFIQEVERVLKPNGSFLLIDNVGAEEPSADIFINSLEKMRDYSHGRSLKITEWEKLLSSNHLTVVKQEKRKKTLPYNEWVNRTLDKQSKIEEVKQYILAANTKIKDYFQIKIEHEEIKEFTIDEWMVLCTKSPIR